MKGYIESIDLNTGDESLIIKGYAFIEKENINFPHKIKKSLVIRNKEKVYYIPTNNTLNTDVTRKFGKEKYNYDYAGFNGKVYVGYIDNMESLSEGTWEIGICIWANGIREELELEYIGLAKITDEKLNYRIEDSEDIKEINLLNEEKNICIQSKRIKYDNEKEYDIKNKKISGLDKIHKKILKKKRSFGNRLLQNIYKITNKMNIKSDRVTFLSDSRVDFSGNFEFIKKELDKRGGYEIKSMLKESIQAERSLKEMIKMVYYISTSRYVLLDDYYPQIYKFKIRDGVEVVQLWHATGAFKTFGFSRVGKKGGPKFKSKNHRNYTKAIVSSENIKVHYAEAFGIEEKKILGTGVPRTDIFFDEEYKERVTKNLYEKYPVLKDKKIIMFAPTFRGAGQKTAYYDFHKFDIERLQKKFGDEYKLIIKLHPFINNTFEIKDSFKDFVVDLSEEREINDLLFISDILITDYSSVCFEYSLLNKPMIFFAYDLDEYIADRDFYYPYESFVPGAIVKDMDELVKVIEEEKFESEKLERFRENFFDHFDGKSTERVVDEILKV
ncbi:CDP-glycerol glycerophosphotransferase family protein [uncultured Clostridium sp.]|uniref:CDP-glycerol glycerophosphotransferase family protein n=1 Tax=uncultured Clostridium sp. TaxID=59620 RepID=UPI0026167D88|nr:CDP-glycerol glycerophosphotransferase family protein [uncultured Clostridium sp.]